MGGAATRCPLLDRLRRDTGPLHEQIEASVPILRPGAGLPEYRSYLAALLGFHRPVEAALARVDGLAALPLDLAARWKTPYLAADLETLGMPDVMGHASRYLRCYGAETGARWQSFCGVLDGATDHSDAIVAAAVDTFRTLHRWLDA